MEIPRVVPLAASVAERQESRESHGVKVTCGRRYLGAHLGESKRYRPRRSLAKESGNIDCWQMIGRDVLGNTQEIISPISQALDNYLFGPGRFLHKPPIKRKAGCDVFRRVSRVVVSTRLYGEIDG